MNKIVLDRRVLDRVFRIKQSHRKFDELAKDIDGILNEAKTSQ